MKPWIALAAMAKNRVIGNGHKIPWHLPEDFKWFKEKTMGQVIVMGRKTFESIGKPLPKRDNIVITRQTINHPNIVVLHSFDDLCNYQTDKQIIICGGAQIYQLALPHCQELFISHVHRNYTGNILFPPFEDNFRACETTRETSDFKVVRYIRKGVDLDLRNI